MDCVHVAGGSHPHKQPERVPVPAGAPIGPVRVERFGACWAGCPLEAPCLYVRIPSARVPEQGTERGYDSRIVVRSSVALTAHHKSSGALYTSSRSARLPTTRVTQLGRGGRRPTEHPLLSSVPPNPRRWPQLQQGSRVAAQGGPGARTERRHVGHGVGSAAPPGAGVCSLQAAGLRVQARGQVW